jgi:ribonucleoside-diphosphate reductase alpha chain
LLQQRYVVASRCLSLTLRADNILGGDSLQYDINEECLAALKENGRDTPDVLDEIRKTGKLGHIKQLPDLLRAVFVTAGELTWQDHVQMQAAFQFNTDNAISKTINFNNNATHQDIRDAYISAWENDCKGCTVVSLISNS